LSAEEFDMLLKGFDDERFELWRVCKRSGQSGDRAAHS